MYFLTFDSQEDTQTAYQNLLDNPNVESVESEQAEYPDDLLLPADTIAGEFGYEIVEQDEDSITFMKSFQTMRLIVDSPKQTIHGDDYGAVRTITDGKEMYILQFNSVEDTKDAYEILSAMSGVTVEEDQIISLEEETGNTESLGSAVDLAAPGVDIQSAVPNGYRQKSGTSRRHPM